MRIRDRVHQMNKENKLQASLPKGFKDRWGDELALKNKLVGTIKEVFINYSFEQLETPEFEPLTQSIPILQQIRDFQVQCCYRARESR